MSELGVFSAMHENEKDSKQLGLLDIPMPENLHSLIYSPRNESWQKTNYLQHLGHQYEKYGFPDNEKMNKIL